MLPLISFEMAGNTNSIFCAAFKAETANGSMVLLSKLQLVLIGGV
jgi:hypothetical protein